MTTQLRVETFFDEATNTASHVAIDPSSSAAAIIDSVLDYDAASGRTSKASADRIIDFVRRENLQVEWILETHVHADHLSAAPYLRQELGGKTGIGEHIIEVQDLFGKVFNAGPEFPSDGRQFDHLFGDGEAFRLGNIDGHTIHTPGHTPACMTFVIGDAHRS